MNRLLKKQKINKLLNSKVFLFFLLFLALFLGNASFKLFKKTIETKQYLNVLKSDYSSLEERYNQVSDDLDYYNSKVGMEKEIRTKYDLSLEGEKAILIIDDEIPQKNSKEKKSFLGKIKDFVSF